MAASIIKDRRFNVPNHQATPITIKIIGKAIKDASSYLPLRNWAAAIAATAPRKDYTGQLKAIWRAFNKRWRYVRDPHGLETVTTSPKAVFNLVIGHNGGAGNGYGVGDCDDAAVAIGALLKSVGFPVRIATTAPPGLPGLSFTHVFVQAQVPGRGWVTVDPVLLPNKNLGDTAPHGRLAIWDLNGKIIATRGISARRLKRTYKMQGV